MNPNLIILKKGAFRFLSQRKTTRENFKMGVNSTYIMAILFIGILGIYYVLTLNINSTKGYNIRNIELERSSLTIENDLIEIKLAQLNSLSNLMKWDGIAQMEKIDKAEYLVVKDMKNYAFNNN